MDKHRISKLTVITASIINTANPPSTFSDPPRPKTPDGKFWSANRYFYSQLFSGSIAKRNLTILPNDNGRFSPDYELIQSRSFAQNDPFVDVLGSVDYSLVSLENFQKDFSNVFQKT